MIHEQMFDALNHCGAIMFGWYGIETAILGPQRENSSQRRAGSVRKNASVSTKIAFSTSSGKTSCRNSFMSPAKLIASSVIDLETFESWKHTGSRGMTGIKMAIAGNTVHHALELQSIEADGDRMKRMGEKAEARFEIGDRPFVTDDVEVEGPGRVHYGRLR